MLDVVTGGMAKRGAEEMKVEVLQVVEEERGRNQDSATTQCVGTELLETQITQTQQHPYAFHVSGPRNVPSINWRDLINSTWSVKFIFFSFLKFWICMLGLVFCFHGGKSVSLAILIALLELLGYDLFLEITD